LATPQQVIVSTWAEALAYDAAPAAAACRVPVLRIDARFPADIERFRSYTPQLLTAQVLGAGHFLQLEVPDQVNAMIERFLAICALGVGVS
jgi:pimeloyl-ACP methyl ester carboxylesterase